jgi:hypothetical protein
MMTLTMNLLMITFSRSTESLLNANPIGYIMDNTAKSETSHNDEQKSLPSQIVCPTNPEFESEEQLDKAHYDMTNVPRWYDHG